MLVFGDAVRLAGTREMLAGIAERLSGLDGAAPDITLHAGLVELFIDASELAQGIADAEFEAAGRDIESPARVAAMHLVMALTRRVARSWRNRFRTRSDGAERAALGALRALALPDILSCRRQEGFAHYTVYPESYLEAARVLLPLADVRVIGIRSIGAGLAASVAVGAGARAPITVRPVGHPFQRRLSLGTDLIDELLRGHPDAFAIADEGPGLSGSSFGAVADRLESEGVPRQRIRFFPSHAGDLGPQASAAHRERWRSAARHSIDFDALALRPGRPSQGLAAWVGDLTGAPDAALDDISGGEWRRRRFAGESHWPPANVQQERRKFLVAGADGAFLLKFAGLGRYGLAKAERARALAQAGFTPECLGYRHGFLVERWLAETRPLDVARVDRDVLIARLGDYLGFRARRLPAGPRDGASLADLGDMLRQNAKEGLGPEFASVFEHVARELVRHEDRVRRVATDNRLHAWEWLETPDGRLLKSDALDHCEAHDLVGCQDIAWDIAGAAAEFDLSPGDQRALCRRIEHASGVSANDDLAALLAPCYLAFQLGAYTMAATALRSLANEACRLSGQAQYYADRLRLCADRCG